MFNLSFRIVKEFRNLILLSYQIIGVFKCLRNFLFNFVFWDSELNLLILWRESFHSAAESFEQVFKRLQVGTICINYNLTERSLIIPSLRFTEISRISFVKVNFFFNTTYFLKYFRAKFRETLISNF